MNANTITKGNIYDVSTYSDKELYDILDLDNPTDRELEAKILSMVNKYTRLSGNMSADLLSKFFIDIYSRFFELSTDEYEANTTEGFQQDIKDTENTSRQFETDMSNDNSQYDAFGNTSGTNIDVVEGNLYANGELMSGKEYDVGARSEYITQNQPYSGNTQIIDVRGNVVDKFGSPKITRTYNTPKVERKGMLDITQNERNVDNTQLTKPIDYTKDTFTPINPLLKQTIKRVISIDSQYRDNKKTSSTEFTFNLSEPLRDVVSLKLYSVQIPYTWYTINSNYGGNFFFIKGNGPIDNDFHYYKIQIKSGNYSAGTLIAAVKESMSQLPQKYPDVSFGLSTVSYTESSVKTTLTIEIKEVFGESNYYLKFPEISPDMGNSLNRLESLAGYLGYNRTQYECCSVYSATHEPIVDTIHPSVSLLDSSINIIVYTDDITKPYEHKTIYIENQSDISSYSSLLDHINRSISKCDFLDVVQSKLVIEPAYANNRNLHYIKLVLKLKRWVLSNIQNSKVAVLFPNDTIWSGPTSLFQFKTGFNVLNRIESETINMLTKYKIADGTQIRFKCIRAGFEDPKNDYIVPLYPTPYNSYGKDLTSYIAEINQSIQQVDAFYNNISVNLLYKYHPFIVNNTPISNVYLNSVNYLNIRVGVQKVFNNSDYTIRFVGSELGRLVDTGNLYNLYEKNVFTSSKIIDTEFTFTTDDKIYIESVENNLNGKPENFTINLQGISVNDLSQLESALTNSIRNVYDINNEQPFVNSRVSVINTNEIKIQFNVNKVIPTSGYEMYLIGNAISSSGITLNENAWHTYFGLNEMYNLTGGVNNIITITNNREIRSNKIRIDSSQNNYFDLIPIDSQNTDGLTNIRIVLKKFGEYTVDELYKEINDAFSENSIISSSTVDFVTFNDNINTQTVFKINVNKVYNTSDYRVVFYDPYSFVTCYTGATRSGSRSVQNTTWDTTLGWVLGFRENIEYNLNSYLDMNINDINIDDNNTVLNYYIGNACVLTGDTTVSTSLYNYFLIVLDDYTQNHLNDGLVTITTQETTIDVGKYKYVCDPYSPNSLEMIAVPAYGDYRTMKQQDLYAFNQKVLSKKVREKSYSKGPFVKDVFGIIPIKTSGLTPGSIYVEFGGTLQNQERMYFGPVNIHRMTIRLLNDRGDYVDLNNANWSFSLVCEQLYRNNI